MKFCVIKKCLPRKLVSANFLSWKFLKCLSKLFLLKKGKSLQSCQKYQ